MKKLILFVIVLLLITAFKEATKQSLDNGIKAEVFQERTEWVILFDGTNFNNWRGYLNENMYDEWVIEDGAMAFTPGAKGGKNIISKNKYTNFTISLEWKISEGGNSGIFWGVYEDENFPEPYQTGPEIQVLDNKRHPDSFLANGTRKAGAIYDMLAYPPENVNPSGQWNLCVIEVNQKANLGKVTMNGKDTITFPVHGPDWDNMVTNSKFKDWEGFGKHQTGHIGLQDHGNKVWYRNIKIKEL